LIFHPSGAWLVSASPNDGQVKFWCASSGNLRLSVPFADARIVAFSADGRWAAIGGEHKLSLYEVSGAASQCPIASRGMVIRAIGLTVDGQLATIASRHPTSDTDRGATVASIWDRSGRPLENVVEQSTQKIIASERVVASPDGNSTIFLSGDGALISREATGKQRAMKLGRIQDLAIDSAGHYWTIENNRTLVLRAKGLEREGREITLNWPWTGRKDLACIHAGREHVVVGCTNGYLRILQLDGKPIGKCACFDEKKSEFLIERSTTINVVDISRDGGLVAAGTEAGRLWLYRLPCCEKVCDWTAHAGRVTSVAFDPSGDWLATGGQDAAICLWRRTGERYEHYLTIKRSGSAAVRQLLFSTDGQCLWVVYEKESMVRAWNMLRMKEEFTTTGLDH
jgi:WD40 repeat protein